MYIHTLVLVLAAISAFLLRRRPVLMLAALAGFWFLKNQIAAFLYRVFWPAKE